MSSRTQILALAFVLLAALTVIMGSTREPGENAAVAEVVRGDLTVQSTYRGRIEARHEITIVSRFKGFATVVELAREGIEVRPGDMLARFDAADLERELLRLEEELALAQSERESQLQAKIPMELGALRMDLRKAEEAAVAEQQYLEDSLALASDNVISAVEIEQQKARVSQLHDEAEAIRQKLRLTKEFLHPAIIRRADAKLHAARRALELARKQMESTVIKAPAGGVLVYKPMHIGGEYRKLRVGDSLHANQPFMLITDLADLVMKTMVPESELSQVHPGQEAIMVPQAYPQLRLQGVVEKVGVIAEKLPNQSDWQNYFELVIGIDDADGRLRPGMSMVAHVISEHRGNALLIPRRAVWWEQGQPYCSVQSGTGSRRTVLQLGLADETHYEVVSGLEPGVQVQLR